MKLKHVLLLFNWVVAAIGVFWLVSFSYDLMSTKSTFQNTLGLLLLAATILGVVLLIFHTTKKQNTDGK